MNRLRSMVWSGALGAALLLTSLTGCGDTSGSEAADAATRARLTDQATQVAAALDMEFSRRGKHNDCCPATFDRAFLSGKGVDVDPELRITEYAVWQPGAERPDDLFHEAEFARDDYRFCISESSGAWLTYGSLSGVQASGAHGTSCRFTGRPDEEAPFDPRRYATELGEPFLYGEDGEDEIFDDGGDSYPFTLEEAHDFADRYGPGLPDGWRMTHYEGGEYTPAMCLLGPEGRWWQIPIAPGADVRATGLAGHCPLADRGGRGGR